MSNRFFLVFVFALSLAAPAFAEETKPDDTVSFDLSAEDWVTTKTAHVTLNVEASVTTTNAGTMRVDMTRAVNDAAKADWRLVSFTRTQDQTGMERWSVAFDARLPESSLNGLADSAKKSSKPGLQITVANIDFSPTLDESEAVRGTLRTHIYKEIADQLVALNTSLPGRNYRISRITFDAVRAGPFHPMRAAPMIMSARSSDASNDSDTAQEHSQKMTQNAQVEFAAVAPAAVAGH